MITEPEVIPNGKFSRLSQVVIVATAAYSTIITLTTYQYFVDVVMQQQGVLTLPQR